MGYTHYINNTKSASKSQIRDWIKHTNNLIVKYNEQCESEEYKIFDCQWENWESKLTLSDDSVRVNGHEPSGNNHETFYIGLDMDGDFCKTARKPYDKVVCASYILGEYLTNGIIKMGSDGHAFDKGYGIDQEILDSIEFLKSIYPDYDIDKTIDNTI